MAQQSNKSLMAQARLTEEELAQIWDDAHVPAFRTNGDWIEERAIAHAQQLKDWRTIVAWLEERAEEDISLEARVADIARMSTLKSTADALQAQLTAAEQEERK